MLGISLSCLLGVACLGDFSSVWLVCLDVFVDLGVNLVVGCCLFGLIWCLLLVGWFWVVLWGGGRLSCGLRFGFGYAFDLGLRQCLCLVACV